MKVVVVGSGALGGYFGFTFAGQGQDVVLVDVDPAKVKEIGEKPSKSLRDFQSIHRDK